ncbi:MAG TPA: hypothetical protein DHV14_06740 [Micrococcales bacterium]|nr:hypothetical protein [Micrococcales bacterium]
MTGGAWLTVDGIGAARRSARRALAGGLPDRTARLPVATGGFAARVAAAIGALGTTPTDLQRAIDAVRAAPRPDVG